MQVSRFYRATTAVLLLLATAVAGATSPTPASGTLTATSGPLNYDSAVFVASNPSATGSLAGVELTCQDPALPCDDFALTITLPAGYETAHPFDTVLITIGWDNPTGQSDLDTYLYNNPDDGVVVASGASSSDPETISLPAKGGTKKYLVRTVPYVGSGVSYHGNVKLVTSSMAAPPPVVAPVPKAGEARFHIYYPGKDQGHNGSGEFNIGYNPFSHNIMSFAASLTYRTTLPQYLTPALPESCAAVWTDVTPVATMTGLDPILFTSRESGRTLASNFTGGANALYAYTDDDGANWTQVGASPPNLGADHQTLATGPYPTDSVSQGYAAIAAAAESVQAHPPAKPYASYYCSQDVVGPATCQRSDTGGNAFGPGVPIYDGTTTPCGGLHGHAHVGPDGAVYVPVPNCSTGVGGTVSTDAGTTWTNFVLPNSAPSSTDPSIAIDAANVIYECYANGADGSMFAQVSADKGKTWSKLVDLGASFGLRNTVFPHAEAGKAGRASCAFLGTTVNGNHQAADFGGIWYPFIATTYDGGTTWVTVNISPDDPVQGVGGIWNQGGGPTNRNLLDFNEGTQDEHGRTIFGYDDGCVGNCILDPTVNSYTADSRIAVQSGGRTLWEDVTEPAAPNASCLAGTRNKAQSNLTWAVPDNGGAPITNYKVYRSTQAAGPFTYIGQTGTSKNAYVDQTVDPNVPVYYYRVTAFNNGVATEGKVSNVVPLPIVADAVLDNVCLIPGLTTLTDGSGDSTTGVPGTDLLSYSLSQPEVADGQPIKLVFTIKTDPGMNPQTPGSAWYVSFKTPDGMYRGVRMDYLGTAPTAPTFSSYVVGANTNGATDGRFVDSMKAADAGSKYDSANGIITLVVSLADLNLKVGDQLTGFNAATTITTDPAGVGAGATQTVDEMPDGLGRTGAYSVLAQGHCKAATTPTNPGTPSGPVTTTPVGQIGSAPSATGSTRSSADGRFGGAAGLLLLLPLGGLALARRRRR